MSLMTPVRGLRSETKFLENTKLFGYDAALKILFTIAGGSIRTVPELRRKPVKSLADWPCMYNCGNDCEEAVVIDSPM